MKLRALRRDDSGALLEMWNAAARFDPLTPGLLAEKLWGDDAFDPDMALVCEDGGLLAGFAIGVMRRTRGDDTGMIKLAAVAAERRRCGIGSRVFGELEDALRTRGAKAVRVCESAPNYLTPGVDARYSAAPHFLSERGYRRIGEACNMTVDLAEREFDTGDAERMAGLDGIFFRRAGDDDYAGLMGLLRSYWPTWIPEVRAALENSPASIYVAVRGDDVLAFAAFDANNRGTGWFGPMGTAPSSRRRGIGHVLLFRCLADMTAQGHRHATIPWVDPVDFYRQCAGAAVSRIFHRYEKVLTS